jgi:signal transduction histidine kinase
MTLLAISTLLLAGGVAFAVFIGQSFFRKTFSIKTIANRLIDSSKPQADALIPTFIVPEQRAGVEILLKNIIENEELTNAEILDPDSSPPSEFRSCKVKDVPFYCISDNGAKIGSFYPITEGDEKFGILFKEKRVSSFIEDDQVVKNMLLLLLTLGFAFIFLLIGVTHLTATQVPSSLDQLVHWVENFILNDSIALQPNLRFSEFNILATRIAEVIESGQKAREQSKLGALAAQVAHDIRSPLAALNLVERDLSVLPEESRILIRSAVGRIRDIANHLLAKNRIESSTRTGSERRSATVNQDAEIASSEIFGLIEGILSEKRIQYRSNVRIKIEGRLSDKAYDIFSVVDPSGLKRVISNLVDNSVEAIIGDGRILVTLLADQSNVEIKVCDNGKGIPPAILSRLTNRGETYGKTGGSGLGLYHARTSCESWAGTLKISSELKLGTEVTITLPRARPPEWFVDKLRIVNGLNIIILDDDQSIHQIWDGRFDAAGSRGLEVNVYHFFSPDQLRDWCLKHRVKDALYLIDNELLGFRDTGLSLVEELNLGSRAILVSSHCEESEVRERCLQLGMRLIPKAMAGFVPIDIDGEGFCKLPTSMTRETHQLKVLS